MHLLGDHYFTPHGSKFRVKWNGTIYSNLDEIRSGTGEETIDSKADEANDRSRTVVEF